VPVRKIKSIFGGKRGVFLGGEIQQDIDMLKRWRPKKRLTLLLQIHSVGHRSVEVEGLSGKTAAG